MKKQLQFQLWQECNSRCKFCYLGKENIKTPDKIKLLSLQKTIEKIHDLSLYQEYDTIAFLGGEFFQGQLNTPQIKNKFIELIKYTVWLLNNQYIKNVWIYVTLTIGDQKDLYQTLKLFQNHKGTLWLLTSYDTIGRFHTQKMLDNWDYHMKNIHKLYPDILFNITTIITQDLIDKYLNDQISFQEIMKTYHAQFFFKQCGAGDYTKEQMNEILPHFYPPRHKFLNFLKKFRVTESPEMWTKLFNIQYRADTLYRNFNDENNIMVLNKRHKNSKNQIQTKHVNQMLVNTCGHLLVYSAYIDSPLCVVCDKQAIQQLID